MGVPGGSGTGRQGGILKTRPAPHSVSKEPISWLAEIKVLAFGSPPRHVCEACNGSGWGWWGVGLGVVGGGVGPPTY